MGSGKDRGRGKGKNYCVICGMHCGRVGYERDQEKEKIIKIFFFFFSFFAKKINFFKTNT